MWKWLADLLKGGEEVTQGAEARDGDTTGTTIGDMSAPRRLSPVDAATIQARFNALGIYDVLEPHHRQELKRIIFTHCREQRVEIWWWPLRAFIANKRAHSGQFPFQVMNTRCLLVKELKERVISLEELMRAEGVQIRSVRLSDGTVANDQGAVESETYRIEYQLAGERENLNLETVDGCIDVRGFVSEFNALSRKHRWARRLVVLPPQEHSHCVVQCSIAAAERAAASNWGVLEYAD